MLEFLKKIDRALFPDLLVKAVAHETRDSSNVLDVGCGEGGPMARVPKPARLTGLDGHAPTLEKLRTKGGYDELVCADLIQAPFAKASFDTVVCLDVIEHFEKPQALALIAKLEQWASRKIVLATPNGFLPSGQFDDNPLQVHRCGFSVSELRDLGYKVYGVGGPKWLRGQFAELRFWPKPLWHRISGLLQPLTWLIPQAAFGLVAVKVLKP